jgi:aminopeptidase N
MKNLKFALLVLVLSSCSSAVVNPKAYDPQAATHNTNKLDTRPTALSREMAWLRAHQISQVSYSLWFGVDEDHDDYEGRVVVNFELKDLKKSLGAAAVEANRDLYSELKDVAQVVALDFEEGTIRSIAINGTTVDIKEIPGKRGPRYDGHRIYFHSSELAPSGANRVNISFSHKFATDGYGFHRFRDPVDQKVYVYSNFEPYGAHRMFPCFDQPDLKASFELTVESPESWQVISNTMERDVTTVDGRKSWAFPLSPLISTYLFALHAGPFQMWHQDANGIPMRLFARQSLKQYVDANEWFTTTRKGLEFYSTFFAYPYPYSKYDQIVVPDFNAGAMENAAAITFTEGAIRRTKATAESKRRLAGIILHEMAHQWFGDLVTMKWWSGLWLNESFATFMSTKAMSDAIGDSGAWIDFNSEKEWAYHDDQLVTTHPIEVPVADTDQAETIFDGISYGKGAAALNQLMFYLGEDDFREGLQRYFQKYALRNTTTHDFVRMLGEASGKDLSGWQKSWLHLQGLNGVKADWACDGSVITKFNLVQTPPEGMTELRTHRTEIALYDANKAGDHLLLRKKKLLTVTYAGASTQVGDAIGKACPAFVYPNSDDYDYVKVELDPVSLAAASRAVGSIESTLQRQMIWATLYQMVVDGKMRTQDLADAILNSKEKNTQLLSRLLSMLTGVSSRSVLLKYMPDEMRKEYQAKIESFTMKHLKTAPAGSDEQKIWFNSFTGIAQSAAAVTLEQGLLSGKVKLPGLSVQQQDRWTLIHSLAAAGVPEGSVNATALIDAELAQDNTDMGQNAAISARAAIPLETSKKEQWTKFVAPIEDPAHALPIAKLRQAMGSFVSVLHPELTRPYVTPYFLTIPKLESMSASQFPHYFPGYLYPSLCEQSIVDQTTSVLKANPGLPPGVIKSLKISRQEEERCIRGRSKAAQSD